MAFYILMFYVSFEPLAGSQSSWTVILFISTREEYNLIFLP